MLTTTTTFTVLNLMTSTAKLAFKTYFVELASGERCFIWSADSLDEDLTYSADIQLTNPERDDQLNTYDATNIVRTW